MSTASRAPGTPRVPSLVPRLGPLVRRLLGAGVPMGPNVLLTVRGRTSGLPRTFPVAIIELGDRRFVQSPFGEVHWVRNLRAAGAAVVTRGHRREEVRAVELTPQLAGPILRDAFAPYVRSRLARPLLGRFFRVGVDSTLDDYVDEARRHPTFELIGDVPGFEASPGERLRGVSAATQRREAASRRRS